MEIEEIEQRLCNIYNIEQKVLYVHDRHRKGYEIECLHFLWYILHYQNGLSPLTLARRYKKSTRNVKYAIAKIKCGVETQKYYQDNYKIIMDALKKGDSI